MTNELSLHETIRLSTEVGEAYIDGVRMSKNLSVLAKDLEIELDAIDRGYKTDLKRLVKSWVLIYQRLQDVAETVPVPESMLGIKGIAAMRRVLDIHVSRRPNLRTARQAIEDELGEKL